MASLRSVHIIEGKHSLSADLMVALVLKSGLAEYFQLVETTDKICTYETKRRDAPQPQRLSYAIEQAEKADLLKPSRSGKLTAWQKMPKQMLRASAASRSWRGSNIPTCWRDSTRRKNCVMRKTETEMTVARTNPKGYSSDTSALVVIASRIRLARRIASS